MKRTLEDIRDLPGELRAPCDWCHPCYTCRDLMRDSADEIERLREYRDHHEFVLSQIEALTRVKISTIDDVLAEIKGLNAVVAKLTRDYNSLEDDVRYNGEALARSDEMKGEIDRLQAIVADADSRFGHFAEMGLSGPEASPALCLQELAKLVRLAAEPRKARTT